MEYEQSDLLDWLAAAVEHETTTPADEPFDPMTLLANMGLSAAAAASCMGDFLRYTAGEPLVRKHRRLDEGWSFLCPDPRCQVWRAGYETAGECRVGWFRHGVERRHDFELAWPGSVPFEPVYQMIAEPNGSSESQVADLVRRGVYVDVAGRVLDWVDCPCLAIVGDFQVSQVVAHRKITGTTCTVEVECPRCSSPAGRSCDGAFGHFDWMFGGPSVHHERRELADLDEDFRRAGGDLTLPAPWRPDLAPTARRTPRAAARAAALLHVGARMDTSDLLKALVREMLPVGRLRWNDEERSGCMILHPDVDSARWMSKLLADFYGISKSVMSVEPIAATEVVFRSYSAVATMTKADAEAVMRDFSGETPLSHLRWAAGVLSGGSASAFLRDKLSPKDFARECSGVTAGSMRYSNELRGFTVEWREGSDRRSRTVTWPSVVSVIDGKVPAGVLREMRVAVDESAGFPLYSREWWRAGDWCHELVMRAWESVRPADLVVCDRDREVFRNLSESR